MKKLLYSLLLPVLPSAVFAQTLVSSFVLDFNNNQANTVNFTDVQTEGVHTSLGTPLIRGNVNYLQGFEEVNAGSTVTAFSAAVTWNTFSRFTGTTKSTRSVAYWDFDISSLVTSYENFNLNVDYTFSGTMLLPEAYISHNGTGLSLHSTDEADDVAFNAILEDNTRYVSLGALATSGNISQSLQSYVDAGATQIRFAIAGGGTNRTLTIADTSIITATAVPEPSTFAAFAGIVVLAGAIITRRLGKK